MMEVETDPLLLKDPLDCSNNENDYSLEGWPTEAQTGVPEWTIRIKPKMNLRKRKPKRMKGVDEKEIDSDTEWKLSGKSIQKRSRVMVGDSRRKCSRTKSVSDEENLIPNTETIGIRVRNKSNRNNYAKKYKFVKDRRKYVCDFCDKTFMTGSHLKEHILNHTDRFPCEECGKVFAHSRSLQRHVAAEHDLRLDIVEVDTDETTSHQKEEKHREKKVSCKKYYETLKSERKYQCEICQKHFITLGHLNTHMYCHSGKKWKCEGCGKNFSCERSLSRHKDTFPGQHWFPCQLCDMNFFRVVNIVKHMEIKHPEASIDVKHALELNLPLVGNGSEVDREKLFICTKCSKIFFSSESLRIHREAVHPMNNFIDESESQENDLSIGCQAPKYKCEICLKEFISLEGFEYHKQNQHVEKNAKKNKRKRSCGIENGGEDKSESSATSFSCKVCSESFIVKSALASHLKCHNLSKNVEVKSGSHQCCICPRSFASSDGLKYHLATHTGERRYSCAECGKKFIKKTHLFEHIATHSQVKYFKCSRCPRKFSTHSSYRKHIKHFPGPHSFPCTKCGKLFTKESMLEKHMCVDLVKVTMAPEVKALLSGGSPEDETSSRQGPGAPDCTKKTEDSSENKREKVESEESLKNSDGVILKSESDSGPHSCYKCFKVFPSLSTLQTHQYEHIGKQYYQCRFCPENFKRADDFGVHIRSHLGSSPYMCLKCNRKFISPLTLSVHAKKYPGDHSFTCDRCQRWFPSEKRLEKHECILQNTDIFICACSSVFKSWNEFLDHAGSKPYKCCSCDVKYPTLTALARHVKKHTGIKPFPCEVCGKSFRTKNNYMHHRNAHNEVKEIQCEHCEFKSKSQKRMDFHLFRKHEIGSNSSSTLCSICGKIFPYKTHIKKHMEMEHSNELIAEESKEGKKSLSVLCTLCGKLLSNKYMLANHMKKVHDPDSERTDREVTCNVCEEKFRSKKRLQRHEEIHETPGLRACEICSKEFYFAKDLRKHMRKHDTNKPYSCGKCGKNFKVSVSLKYHSSICGNFGARNSDKRRREEEKLTNANMLFGHIEPLDANSSSHSTYSALYKRWNP